MTLTIDGQTVSAPALQGDLSTPATVEADAVVWLDQRGNGAFLAFRVVSIDTTEDGTDYATLVPASARDIARRA